MYTKTTAMILVAAMLILVATPVGAITYGEPDENRHPNVGLTLTDINGDGTLLRGCSGTLISPTVFLTAGHCTIFFSRFGNTKTWITFDSNYDPEQSTLVSVAGFATHPGYNNSTLFNDVGVVLLAEEVTGVVPGVLPSENLLDEMKAAGTLKGQMFMQVGYGATADFKGNPPLLTRDDVRRFSMSPYVSLTTNWLHLSGNNDATGEGGGCLGDSGAPRFLGESNVIVAVTSWGDSVCRSLNMAQRVDTASVRAFLDDYMPLP
jgi:secreted trypsin-like serine protease